MKTQRILVGAAWLATVAIAYFIGGSGENSHPAAAGNSTGEAANAIASQPASMQGLRANEDSGETKPGKGNVAALIARARLEMGSGMGGMMNIRGMLRAIAPIAELDDSQIQEALVEVEKSVREPQQKMMFYSLLLGQWAETDGPAAMAYAQTKLEKNSMFEMGVISSVLGTWAHHDPEAVWKWFEVDRKDDDGSGRTRMMAVNSVFAGMASNNLESAFSHLSSLDEQSRTMALSGIAMGATDDASRMRVLDRASALPPDQRAQLRQAIASQWAMSNPDDAIAWIKSLPADEQKPLRTSAGQTLLMTKPSVAADFMLENADDKDRSQIYNQVAMQWAYQDPRAAGEWLTKQSQGPELDSARQTYAMAVVQRDPAGAMDWARSVQDESQRAQSIGQIYQMWRAKDAAAADAALDASGLPADKVKEIQAVIPASKPGAPTQIQVIGN